MEMNYDEVMMTMLQQMTMESQPPEAPSVRCPQCAEVFPYEPARLRGRLEDRCSHDARIVYAKGHCCICLDDHDSPMIVLACGHVVCKGDFKELNGRMGDEAMKTRQQVLGEMPVHPPIPQLMQNLFGDRPMLDGAPPDFAQFLEMMAQSGMMAQHGHEGNHYYDDDDEYYSDEDDYDDYDDDDYDSQDDSDDSPPPLLDAAGRQVDDASSNEDDNDGPPPLIGRRDGNNNNFGSSDSDDDSIPPLLPRAAESDSDLESLPPLMARDEISDGDSLSD